METDSDNEYVPSSNIDSDSEDDFRVTTQELVAGLIESKVLRNHDFMKSGTVMREKKVLDLQNIKKCAAFNENVKITDIQEPEKVEDCDGAVSLSVDDVPSVNLLQATHLPDVPINSSLSPTANPLKLPYHPEESAIDASLSHLPEGSSLPGGPVDGSLQPAFIIFEEAGSLGKELLIKLPSSNLIEASTYSPVDDAADVTLLSASNAINSLHLPGGLDVEVSQPVYYTLESLHSPGESAKDVSAQDSLPNSLATTIPIEEPVDGSPGAALPEESTHCVGTRKRKSLSDCRTWKRANSKGKRMRGEEYIGFRRAHPKSTKKVLQDVPREARKIRPACVSPLCAKWKNRLCNTITEEERQELFGKFWKEMTWEAKKMFVCGSVEVMKSKRSKVGEGSRRNLSYFYFLRINGEKIPVCQQMYLNTLGITKDEVRYWLENFHASNIPSSRNKENISANDAVNVNGSSPNNDSNSNEAAETSAGQCKPRRSAGLATRKQILSSFFDDLPALPSHYCRSTTSKKYLQGDIQSWTELYSLYVEKCRELETIPFSRFQFDKERQKKNVDIFVPKKDKCDLCSSYEQGGVSEEDYLKHQEKKEEARREKAQDKAAAENGTCHTICFDLMKVVTSPLLRASSAYYKLKLTVHNFTIYNMATHDSKLYWFDETNGNLCASTFASCVVDFLNELLDQSPKDTVVLYSDGCTYQNRNSVLANALLHLSVARNVTIIQKYLEKGHTQMECDSVHSLVERKWENAEVYTPSNFVSLSTAARKKPAPYRALMLDYTFFKDYTQNEVYSSIRPGRTAGDPTVVDLRQLNYDPSGRITFKLNFNDELMDLPYRPKRKASSDFVFSQLHKQRPRIPKDKWSDLQALKPLLPTDTHLFYDSIPCEDVSRRQVKRQEENKKKTWHQHKIQELEFSSS